MWKWIKTILGSRPREPKPPTKKPELLWHIVGGEKEEPRSGNSGAGPVLHKPAPINGVIVSQIGGAR